MRRLLDAIYDGAAGLAAVFMVGLLVMVLLSVLGRQLHFHLPGTDAYAAGFLALAQTLKKGEHIRVTLILQALTGGKRRGLELFALAMAVALAVMFAFYSVRLAWQSYTFHDISTSNDATPLWLPQLSFAIGALVLLIAFVDELVLELRGRSHEVAATVDGEPLRNE